jgi:hypothetical protein
MGQSVATTYRKSASECRVQAARARFADNKARWLDLAEQWELVADRVAEQSIHLASDQDRASVPSITVSRFLRADTSIGLLDQSAFLHITSWSPLTSLRP